MDRGYALYNHKELLWVVGGAENIFLNRDIELELIPGVYKRLNENLSLREKQIIPFRLEEQISFWTQNQDVDYHRSCFATQTLGPGLLAISNLGIYKVSSDCHSKLSYECKKLDKNSSLHITDVINYPLSSLQNIEDLLRSMNEFYTKIRSNLIRI